MGDKFGDKGREKRGCAVEGLASQSSEWLAVEAIAQRQITQVLVSSLTSDQALRKTFELVATKGPAQEDLAALFAALDPDSKTSLDAVREVANQPLDDEPQRIKDDLRMFSAAHQ